MLHEEKVDIDQAKAMMKVMSSWVSQPDIRKELDVAEDAAKNYILSLILTGVVTGDFPNIPECNTRLREKLVMAFDIGYYFCKTHRVSV